MKDFFEAFFSGLSAKEKKVLYVACAVVFVALFDRIILGPIFNESGILQDKIKSQTGLIQRNVLILKYKDAILKKSERLKNYFSSKDLSEEERIAAFLNEIESIGKSSGISLVNINPVNVEDKGKDKLYRLSVDCMGSMKNLLGFIYSVEASESLIRVISYNITPKDRDQYEVKATVTFEKVIIFPFVK
ncbi:MAG: hypothetical protein HQL28_01705 [Candidatus Omnitrophica bacterium]|nr:hypothetical protein [Candidatus Omnitrophota bacterium]